MAPGARRRFAPTTQKRLPSSVTAPLTSAPLKASEIAVDESTTPFPSTRATTRFVAAVGVDATAAVPRSASNPARLRYRPSADSARAPSEVAVPLRVSRRFAPTADVGRAIDCTSVPDGVYSSRNTAVAPLLSAELPSPTRTTTMSPDVNPAAVAGAAAPSTKVVDAQSATASRPTKALDTRECMATPVRDRCPPAGRDSTGERGFDGDRPW